MISFPKYSRELVLIEKRITDPQLRSVPSTRDKSALAALNIIAVNPEELGQWKSYGSKMSKNDWDAYAEPSAYSYTNMYHHNFDALVIYNGPFNICNWPSNLINVR